MSPERGQVCTYCAAIIQGEVQGPDPRPQVSIKTLRKSSESCMLCRILLASNIKTSQHVARVSSRPSEELETFPINIKIFQMRNPYSGLMWATVTTGLFNKASGIEHLGTFMLQVCSVDGTLLI
jgi:hypothetical protein